MKKNNVKITRSSLISIKRTNKNKKEKLIELYNIGKKLTKEYLEKMWKIDTQKYAGKDLYSLIPTNLTARFNQLCCKKAIDIKRSITEKIDKKLFIIDKLYTETEIFNNDNDVHKHLDRINKIEDVINTIYNKPEIDNFNLELNGQFVNRIKIGENKTKLMKNWIRISSLTPKYNMNITFSQNKHFNKFYKDKKFELAKFIQIYKDGSVKVVFNGKIEKKQEGDEIGCDIGLNKVYSLSNTIQSDDDKTIIYGKKQKQQKCGRNLVNIINCICKTKNGSCGNRKKRNYRDNYVRETINKINFDTIKTLYIEDIKYLRWKKKKQSRFLRSWRYTTIFDKLRSKCEGNGVTILQVRPTNTSRMCSFCKWVSINNRDKQTFTCEKCNFQKNSDINAAKNILFIKNKKEILGNSNIGFYFE